MTRTELFCERGLIKIQALHTLWLSFKFWIIAICLWGILIKNLLTWPYLFLFSWSLLSPCRFLPVLNVFLTGEWSSLTRDRDNSLIWGFTVLPHWGYVFSHRRCRSLHWGCWLFMFLVGLMRAVLTFSAVCSQKMYFFVMAVFLIWWRSIWRYLRIVRRVLVFLV